MKILSQLIPILILSLTVTPIRSQSITWLEKFDGNIQYAQIAQSDEGDLWIAIQYTDSLIYHSENQRTVFNPVDTFTVCVLRLSESYEISKSYQYASTYPYNRNYLDQMVLDPANNLYITGRFTQEIIDQYQDTLIANRVGIEAYILKLNPELEPVQAHYIGGWNNLDDIVDLKYTHDGHILMAGDLSGPFDIDFTDSVFTLEAQNNNSPFIVKYTTDLELVWGNSLPLLKRQYVRGVAHSNAGSAFMMIQLIDTFQFEIKGDTVTLVPRDAFDLLLIEWDDASGQINDYKWISSRSQETFHGMDVDSDNNLHLLFKSRGHDLFVNDSLVLPSQSLRLIWMKMNPHGQIADLKELEFHNQQAKGQFFVNQRDELIYSDFFSGGDGMDFDNAGVNGDVFGRKYFINRYSSEAELISTLQYPESTVSEWADLSQGNGGSLFWLAFPGQDASIVYNPVFGDTLLLDGSAGLIAGTFCYPNEAETLLDSTCTDAGIVFSTSGSGFDLYWNDSLVANENSLIPTIPDTVQLVIYDLNGCPTYSEIVIPICTPDSTTSTIRNRTPKPDIVLFPNPVKHQIHFTSDLEIEAYSIYNLLGSKLLTMHQKAGQQKIDLSNLHPGFYLLEMKFVNGQIGVYKFEKVP